MGLDMYLYKKTYVKNWEHNPAMEQHQIEVKKNGVVRNDIKPSRISYIVEEVAYWRKFNALHGWFVEKCAGGVDECQDIYVSEESMSELLNALKEVSNALSVGNVDASKEVLPPTQGFFFGSDDVDDYYVESVNSTIETIETLLKEHEESLAHGLYSGDFYYRASW
jgi:hypothetical protein